MGKKIRFAADQYFFGSILLLLGVVILGSAAGAHATVICPSTQGFNAVWGTTTNCTTPLQVVGSPAFIDASAWCPSTGCGTAGVDFCLMVGDALQQLQTLFPQGGVVDARGVTTINPPMLCVNNPFFGITVPSTVLLPLHSGCLIATMGPCATGQSPCAHCA